MKLVAALVAITLVAIASAQSKPNPGSLWDDEAPNPLLDRVARKVGDMLMVIVSEVSSGNLTANTEASKNDTNTVSPLRLFSWLSLIPEALSSGATSTNTGEGQTNQTSRLTARVTVLVKEVKPNGTMIVEGTRTVTINKETQTFRLTGIVRQDDIRPDNTILSERIAEATIAMEGKGLLNERQRRGLLTRILDWLF